MILVSFVLRRIPFYRESRVCPCFSNAESPLEVYEIYSTRLCLGFSKFRNRCRHSVRRAQFGVYIRFRSRFLTSPGRDGNTAEFTTDKQMEEVTRKGIGWLRASGLIRFASDSKRGIRESKPRAILARVLNLNAGIDLRVFLFHRRRPTISRVVSVWHYEGNPLSLFLSRKSFASKIKGFQHAWFPFDSS